MQTTPGARTRYGAAIVACCLALAGCSTSDASGDDASPSPDAREVASTQPAGEPARTQPLLELPEVGDLSWRCVFAGGDGTARMSSSFAANRDGATTQAAVAIDGRQAARKVLQPGGRLNTPLRPASRHTWTLLQATGGGTTRVTIRVRFLKKPTTTCYVPQVQMRARYSP